MGFPAVGQFYNPNQFGFPWSQPGPGFVVSPQAPTEYPVVPQGFPQQPFAYEGLYSLICGHWTNTIETFEEYDPATKMQAAILCCPVCGVVQAIVEPYNVWQSSYYGLYPIGFSENAYTNPSVNPNLP